MKKITAHLKKDIKEYKQMAHEDRELMKELKRKPKKAHKMHEKKETKKVEKLEHAGKKKRVSKHESARFKDKVEVVMHEFKKGKLHSGSKKGPKVTNPKQAIAIALSEAKRKRK